MRNDSLYNLFLREFNEDNYKLGKGIDIYKVDNHYVVELDLPGFTKEDIQVDYKDDILTIKASKELLEEKNREYFCRTRKNQALTRQIRFSEIDEAMINGEFVDGVLKLTLPIKVVEEVQPRRIEIK